MKLKDQTRKPLSVLRSLKVPGISTRSQAKGIDDYFSKPHAGSDLILQVEGKQLHVHKQLLRVVSQVFDTMFTANFREKNADVVPLPGKLRKDMVKLLRVIYPCFHDDVDGETHVHRLYYHDDVAMETRAGGWPP